ncbi:cobalamin biosynthesis protein [Microlunatus endophyticus]|uniref:Cobalamin biosynthesis protein n=1 Tax=Microlunatus endophyticus TaxID=1716077 RepID=A0A917S3X9_9ACTN|nr:CobW family GTP-binding protein [Microlunatus endophyticus]GGL56158.1 cobalamin biosynthesis protein [Microlunatus endophyticus]
MRPPVPVVTLAGCLGAGKTTLLNHLLRHSDARIGVVVNDFGALNVDAGLVRGQIDDPASIAGGCLCCLPDSGDLDAALSRLSVPRLALDVIVIEASGIAEPTALARLVRSTAVGAVRPAGIVEVVDLTACERTLGSTGPHRFAADSLVVLNKIDLLAPAERRAAIERVTSAVRAVNASVPIIETTQGALDPLVLFEPRIRDVVTRQDELPRSESVVHRHPPARSVAVESAGVVDPSALVDLLENPPDGAYRIKGVVTVAGDGSLSRRRYVINRVGRAIHVAPAPGRRAVSRQSLSQIVAIGFGWDEPEVRRRLDQALLGGGPAAPKGVERLQRYCS